MKVEYPQALKCEQVFLSHAEIGDLQLKTPLFNKTNVQLYILSLFCVSFVATTGEPKKMLWKFDSKTKWWKRLANMEVPRTEFSLVHLDGDVYAVGGETDGRPSVVSSVERYSIAEDKWTLVASLSEKYMILRATTFKGKILVYSQEAKTFGEPASPVFNLEIYNPVTDVWTKALTEKYEVSIFTPAPILMVKDDVCYRIGHKLDKGAGIEDRDDWNAHTTKHVNEIEINERRNGRLSAVIGKEQDQVQLNSKRAFCLNGTIFVYVSDKIAYDTRISVDEADRFDPKDWEVLSERGYKAGATLVEFSYNLFKPMKKEPRSYFNQGCTLCGSQWHS